METTKAAAREAPVSFSASVTADAAATHWPWGVDAPSLVGLADAGLGRVCAEATVAALLARDQPTDEMATADAECDAEALYYGISAPPDYVKARLCAYSQLARRPNPRSGLFAGEGILMMIYANGKGVPTNIPLAIGFACHVINDLELLPGLEGRVFHLLDLRKDAAVVKWHAPPATEFDICDDAMGSHPAVICAAHAERMHAVERTSRRQTAVSGLPEAELHALDRAAAAFFEAREMHEVNTAGSGAGLFVIDERSQLEDEYVNALSRIHDKAFLPNAGEFAKADAALNQVYAQAMTPGRLVESMGTINADGIRATEQLWIPYRDAWARLGTNVRPDVPEEVWKGWLTVDRTNMLSRLLRDGDGP